MAPDNNKGFNKQDNPEDSLEAIKKSLYSRQERAPYQEKEGGFRPHEIEAPKNWGESEETNKMRAFQDPAKRMSFLRKAFLGSLAFFLLSVGVALFVFFGGGNVVSSSNVAVFVNGPVSISGGEVLPLEISISNQNNADLETANLVVDYPDGTREPLNQNIQLKRQLEAIGIIKKGETVTKKIQAVLFGEAGQTKSIKISVEYRLKGSNAIFSKIKNYDLLIISAPVSISVTSVGEINNNQDVEFSIDVISNSTSIIQKLALSAEYPFGFTFVSSNPAPSWSNSFWQLGDIKPGVKRTIKIRGHIIGQDNEDRVFKFSTGSESPTNENLIGTNFLTTTRKITIKQPSLGGSLALDGDTSDIHVARPGKSIRADILLSNNAGTKITDVKVSARLSGNIFDVGSVAVINGLYRASDQTASWDQTLKSDLAVLNPDDRNNLSFSLGTLSESEIRLIKNPEMTLEISVSGKRLNDSGVSEQIVSTIKKQIRVATSLGLSTRAIYSTGVFDNKGPIPPQVDAETSYTIVWSLTNGSTDLSNTKVTATLPSYVKWLATYIPQSEKISYNPIGGQIIWDVGDLKAGTGFSGSPREISFQVSLVPSTSQINTAPTLVTEATASGDDSFAKLTVQSVAPAPLTTNLTTDISFKIGQGNVVK